MTVLEILQAGRAIYEKHGQAPNPLRAYALTEDGCAAVAVDPEAKTFCLLGAVLRACGVAGFHITGTPAVTIEARNLLYAVGFNSAEHDMSTVADQLGYFDRAIAAIVAAEAVQ